MSRNKERKNKKTRKMKKSLFLLIVIIGVFFCSLIVYGQDAFYTMKTFLYKDKALEIKMKIEKKNDLEDIDLNFINEGSCDVYLRGFVFVYPKIEEDNWTILSNSSVKINYGNEDSWFISEDNYIYYTKPLKVGNKTQKPMVESIDIDLSEEDKKMLGSRELGIDIVMEVVQMNNFAYMHEWDIEEDDLESYFNNKVNGAYEEKERIKILIE